MGGLGMAAGKTRREYDTEFKIDAAKLVDEQGNSVPETGERLGVTANITRRVQQYRQGELVHGHKQAQPTEQETEFKRLRAQVKQLEVLFELGSLTTEVLRYLRGFDHLLTPLGLEATPRHL